MFSSDVEAINLCGSGHYYGGVIKNTATNTTATGGDIKATTTNSSSGFALLTLQKQDMVKTIRSFYYGRYSNSTNYC